MRDAEKLIDLGVRFLIAKISEATPTTYDQTQRTDRWTREWEAFRFEHYDSVDPTEGLTAPISYDEPER